MAKRRRKATAGVLVLLLLLLGWHGLGWLDGNPERDGSGVGEQTEAVAETGQPAGPTAELAAGAADPGRTEHPEPGGETHPLRGTKAGTDVGESERAGSGAVADPLDFLEHGPGDTGEVRGGTPYSEDRARGRYRQIELALSRGVLGEAFAAVDELRAMAGGDRERVAAVTELVQGALVETVGELATAVAAGEVLAARARLLPMLRPAHPAVAAALDGMCASRGWPRWSRDPVDGVEALGAVRPLLPQRAVRWHADGGAPVWARIVHCDGRTATLRVVAARAVTFPTVPRRDLEPVDASAAERVDQALVAGSDGAGLLARMWLSAAVAAGAGGETVEQLRRALASEKQPNGG